jgi:hypothetical protein
VPAVADDLFPADEDLANRGALQREDRGARVRRAGNARVVQIDGDVIAVSASAPRLFVPFTVAMSRSGCAR